MRIQDVPPLVRKLPYVDELNFLEHRWYCEGWLAKFHDGKPRKCLRAARWKFHRSQNTKRPRAKTQYVCTYHLIKDCLEYSVYEQQRAKRALKKAGVDIGTIQ
jgi:hypothetical protein